VAKGTSVNCSIAHGDTITILDDSKTQYRVRLHGIDAPERGQAFSAKAKELVGELAAGQTVTLRVTDTDRYGRIVAEVILPGGKNLNHEVVRAGLAWWFRRYAPRDTENGATRPTCDFK
jgi:endonuclease YncB( thermonuclease family)